MGIGKNPKDYQPIDGFYDLREYDIPKKEFMSFWRLQEFLYRCEQARKRGAYKYMQNEFNKVKILSAQYQQMLFEYPLKIR